MRTEDLFPDCQDAKCPQFRRHKHILDAQRELIHSDARYNLYKGGYGSGKTYAAAVLGVLLSINIDGNRGFVGRKTYANLHDSTLRVYLEVIERAMAVEPALRGTRYLENRLGFPHRIVFPNDSEIVFRETKDIGRWLGPEYGWWHLDEVSEMEKQVFTGLAGRLRLQQAGAHRRGILTTNPPHEQHWIVSVFGKDPGVIEIPDPEDPSEIIKYRHITSSTRDNPHLPKGYLGELLTGLTPAEINRLVEGNFGIVPEGPAVYPEFKHERHIGVPELVTTAALVRGWDFGFRHPACAFMQILRCKQSGVHVHILAEADGKEVEGEQFARIVLDATDRFFPDLQRRKLIDCGDTAGAQRSEKGPGPIIRLSKPPFNLRFRHRKIREIDPGLDLIRKMLRGTCKCGTPFITVHRRCHNIINGFAGGYHYPKKPSASGREKPVKDGFYDDFMDAVRYPFENLVRVALANQEWLELTNANPHIFGEGAPGWAWMENRVTPTQVQDEIARARARLRA